MGVNEEPVTGGRGVDQLIDRQSVSRNDTETEVREQTPDRSAGCLSAQCMVSCSLISRPLTRRVAAGIVWSGVRNNSLKRKRK